MRRLTKVEELIAKDVNEELKVIKFAKETNHREIISQMKTILETVTNKPETNYKPDFQNMTKLIKNSDQINLLTLKAQNKNIC
jgi:hypothetical protein